MAKRWILYLLISLGCITQQLSALVLNQAINSLCLYNTPYSERCSAWEIRASCCDDKIWHAFFGYSGDFVFNRYLQTTADSPSMIRRTSLFTNAACLGVDFFNRFNVWLMLGASKLSISTPAHAFPLTSTNRVLRIEMDTRFSWSLGANALLWQWDAFTLSATGSYFSYHSQINYVDIVLASPTYPEDADIHYYEYQAGCAASYHICLSEKIAAIPYIAIKYSRARLNMGNFFIPVIQAGTPESVRLIDLENQKSLGCVIGMTLAGYHTWGISVEGRLHDEQALGINAVFCF